MADEMRRRLGVTLPEQADWRTYGEAFSAWRGAVEGLGVLVFQFSMPLRETRGFSLGDGTPQAIVVNSFDAMTARLFTLLHELAHLCLDLSGLCLIEEKPPKQDVPAERFCNRFAASVLVPKEALLAEKTLSERGALERVPDDEVAGIANRFKVSKYVIWRRLAELGPIGPEAYWGRLDKWAAEPKPSLVRRGRARTPPERCVAERGRRFTSLVLEAKDRDIITYSDMSDFLSLRLRHLGRLESLVRGKSE